MAHFLHDSCSWIKIFINSMTKAHQSKWISFIFWFTNNLVNCSSLIHDLFKHIQDSFIGSSMVWSPKRSDASCYTGIGIRMRASSNSNSRSWCILFMFGMTDPNDFQSSDYVFLNLEFLIHRIWEHHIEKVFHISIILFWVNIRQSHSSSVCIGS